MASRPRPPGRPDVIAWKARAMIWGASVGMLDALGKFQQRLQVASWSASHGAGHARGRSWRSALAGDAHDGRVDAPRRGQRAMVFITPGPAPP